MTVTVFIAFIMGIGAVIAVPAEPAKGNSARLSISADEVPAEPAKGNPACLSISADKVAATGKAFIIVNEKMNYGMARATCKNMGGDLATFKNVKEQKRIMAWAHAKFPEINFVYVGVQIKTKKNKNNEWKWLTGESIPNEDAFAWCYESQKKAGPGALGLRIKPVPGVQQGFVYLTARPYIATFEFICEIDIDS